MSATKRPDPLVWVRTIDENGDHYHDRTFDLDDLAGRVAFALFVDELLAEPNATDWRGTVVRSATAQVPGCWAV